ncbi:maestro heat-like repeat-containing protein family member 6 [Ahaetulla prasina]|uniref:maestro heat-like repeat-containing protein family member 6 n=1 Tax=Ahaetulla prasina TaxID=499056 RepID=UPI00264813E4|nr:maestro heat-like repeat-containing protein family member 6 [Ahaetulla prasina]
MRLIPKRRVLAKLDQWQADPQPVVRWLSFQGLENLALQKQKLRSLEGLVSKMLRGLNEAQEKTVRDTLGALPKILSHHQRRLYMGSLCVLIAKKLRPLLEEEREPERSLAVRLFGELLPWVNVRHKAQMRERILTHLVPFVLHLYDPNQQVVELKKSLTGRTLQ